MTREPDDSLWPSLRTTLSVCVDMVMLEIRVTTDEVAYVLQISHSSAYELMHNKLGFHKVQDGSQNNSQRCINKRAWSSVKNICIAMVTNETSP